MAAHRRPVSPARPRRTARTAPRLLRWLSLGVLPAMAGCSTGPTAPAALACASPSASFVASDAIDYFSEIALGSEWSAEDASVVRKWQAPLQVHVSGAATAADSATLRQVVGEIAELTGADRIRLVAGAGNVEIRFAPVDSFPRLEPRYVPGNYGFVWLSWNEKSRIERASILIASDRVTQRERAHLIREELTQALGLLRDSERYPDSIFYQRWTEVTEYSPLDQAVVRLLYRPEVLPGMSRAQVESALQGTRSTCAE